MPKPSWPVMLDVNRKPIAKGDVVECTCGVCTRSERPIVVMATRIDGPYLKGKLLSGTQPAGAYKIRADAVRVLPSTEAMLYLL